MTPLPDSFLAGHITHRGLHDRADGRPENSLPAFEAAIDRGFAIEMDIQLAACGTAMVFHDDLLDRLTAATGPTPAQSADTLRRMRLLGTDATIPTLAETLALVAGRVPLLIELKDQTGCMEADTGALEDAVLRDLQGYQGDVALMSFNPNSVVHVARHAPHIPRGITTSAYSAAHWPDLGAETRAHLAQIPDLDRAGAGFISHEVAALDMPRVAEVKARGLPVLCWTVRSLAQEIEARRVADAVTFEGYLP